MEKPNIDLSKIDVEELEKVTEAKVFEEPKKMFVWGDTSINPLLLNVYAIMPALQYPVYAGDNDARYFYKYCAEIPENAPKKMPTPNEAMLYLINLERKHLNLNQLIKVSIPKNNIKPTCGFRGLDFNVIEDIVVSIHDKNGLIEGSEHGFDSMREV